MFSDDQLSKVQPLLGNFSCLSYFRATFYMYFPFFTCEVKCGTTGLEIADRQNSHSMTLAVRGIVELFKLAKSENELHRELLTFSISHDHRTVRLYGYYPILDGPKTRIYRHPIHTFDITALDGEERWTTYKFTVAVYNHSLTLLKNIRSVIDELPPDFNPELSQQSEPQRSENTSLSQPTENQNLVEASSSQPKLVDLQQITPETSTQMEKPASRKKKKGKNWYCNADDVMEWWVLSFKLASLYRLPVFWSLPNIRNNNRLQQFSFNLFSRGNRLHRI